MTNEWIIELATPPSWHSVADRTPPGGRDFHGMVFGVECVCNGGAAAAARSASRNPGALELNGDPVAAPLPPVVIRTGECTQQPSAAPSTLGPRSFETEEYRTSWFLGKINAAQAYAAGFTGKGVLVAVVDTGLDIAHPEFTGRVSDRARSFIPNSPPDQMSDEKEGHGTHVSGIIGAARDGMVMHGVAYNATILPLRAIFDDDDDDDDSNEVVHGIPTFRALRYAARNRAKVLNGSYGPDALPPEYIKNPDRDVRNSDPDHEPPELVKNPHYRIVANTFVLGGSFLDGNYRALKAAAKKDIVLVFSAGNENEEQPVASAQPGGIGLYPYIRPANHQNGVYRILELARNTNLTNPNTYKTLDPGDPRLAKIDMSDLQGALIAVVATDRNNEIASYSNRCGVAFLWCIAAPGGDIAKKPQGGDIAEKSQKENDAANSLHNTG